VRPVDEFALASRLSYFLWSSLPDDDCSSWRNAKRCEKSGAASQRMLKDPKVKAFVDNFAGQWLQIRNLKLAAPTKNSSRIRRQPSRRDGEGNRVVLH